MVDIDHPAPLRIMIQIDASAIIASHEGCRMAAHLGFSAVEQTALGTAILEIARNIARYAGQGEITLNVIQDEGRVGIQVVAQDNGPGIPDIKQAMEDGYSTGDGLGLGLPGAKRLMDTFELQSSPGEGTTIIMTKWVEGMIMQQIETGIAQAVYPGLEESGDSYLVEHFPQGALLAVIDGLGHGPKAAIPAQLAVETLKNNPQSAPATLIEHCHKALRPTRGAVISVASINLATNKMTWLGIGNVTGILLRSDHTATNRAREHLLLRGGVVGYNLPSLRPVMVEVNTGDTLVLTTDGLRSAFVDDIHLDKSPQQIANYLLENYNRKTDDALVLVARFNFDKKS